MIIETYNLVKDNEIIFEYGNIKYNHGEKASRLGRSRL